MGFKEDLLKNAEDARRAKHTAPVKVVDLRRGRRRELNDLAEEAVISLRSQAASGIAAVRARFELPSNAHVEVVALMKMLVRFEQACKPDELPQFAGNYQRLVLLINAGGIPLAHTNRTWKQKPELVTNVKSPTLVPSITYKGEKSPVAANFFVTTPFYPLALARRSASRVTLSPVQDQAELAETLYDAEQTFTQNTDHVTVFDHLRRWGLATSKPRLVHPKDSGISLSLNDHFPMRERELGDAAAIGQQA